MHAVSTYYTFYRLPYPFCSDQTYLPGYKVTNLPDYKVTNLQQFLLSASTSLSRIQSIQTHNGGTIVKLLLVIPKTGIP